MTQNPANSVLNENQKKAVKDSSYPSYLQAGAGSGKTRVLVEKVIHILKSKPNISLENFAVITFTNKVADELAARLQDSIYKAWLNSQRMKYADNLRRQIPICNMVDVSTIHGFCERLLRRHGFLIGIPNTFTVKSFRQEVRDIVSKHVNKLSGSSVLEGVSQFKIADLVLELLYDNGNKGLSIDEQCAGQFCFDTPDNDFYNRFKREFVQIYTRSETEILRKKSLENIVTPNDLITLAAKLPDNPQAAKRIAAQYKYLFVDEFQDTNFEQFIFIEKMINIGVKVFVIGDKKQSIYAFRGADVENSDRIDALLKDTKRKNLSINYRTDPCLLNTINSIFGGDFSFGDTRINFPYQALESGVTTDLCDEPFRFEYGKSIVSIVDEITRTVRLGSRQAAYDDIAILCRRNADVDALGRQLKERGVPVEIIGGKGFYSNTEIIDTYKLFNAIVYKSDDSVLESKNTFYNRALSYSGEEKSFDDFLEQLNSVIKTLTVDSILSFIYEKSHAIEYLRRRKQYQAVANLIKLRDKANEMARNEMVKPLQFLENLGVMISTGKDEDEAEVSEEDRKSVVVSIYSIHKAKGLEFNIVVIPNCDLSLGRKTILPRVIYDPGKPSLAIHNSVFGRDFDVPDKDYDSLFHGRLKLNLEEELRILYVACTRAKHMLVLSCRSSKSQILSANDKTVSWAKWVLSSNK